MMLRTAASAAMAALVLSGTASAARADWSGNPPAPPASPRDNPPAPPAVPGAGSESGSTVSRDIGKCHVLSSANFLGVSCGEVSGGQKVTIKQILGKDPLPGCWNEPMSAAEKAALNLQDTPGPTGSTYWWVKCLSGIDPKTLTVQPGGIKISWGWVSIPHQPTKGSWKLVILTENQRNLIRFTGGTGVIPTPVAGISPTGSPVVNQQVAFFDGSPASVTVNATGLQLRAHVTRIVVHPTDDNSSAACQGAGVQVGATDTPQTRADACWYQFKQSSAAQPDGRFAGSMDATWSVEYSSDGGHHWQPLNTFVKHGLSTQQVDEIQALNVN